VKYHRMERFHGPASRSIRLPRDAQEEGVEGICLNGVLRVIVPKRPSDAPKSVPIM
jgi:HSP20 family molecular chaperone IbpA